MVPIFQVPGDKRCFSCCIASLLELEYDQVPYFIGKEWQRRLQRWLQKRGYHYLDVTITDETVLEHAGYHIITGQSPRGEFLHSCVGLRGEIVHDPHPGSPGLLDKQFYGFLIPLDPGAQEWK